MTFYSFIFSVVLHGEPQYNSIMRRSSRSLLLLLLSLSLITILISHISVPVFHNGVPLPKGGFSSGNEAGGVLDQLFKLVQSRLGLALHSAYALQQVLFPLSIILLLLIAAALIFPKELRKRVIYTLLAGLLVLLLFYILFFSSLTGSDKNNSSGEMIITNMDISSGSEGPVEEVIDEILPPEIPTGLSYLFSIVLVLTLAGTVFVIYRRIRKMMAMNEKNDIRDITEKALFAFEAGEDYSDIILRCYNELVISLRKEMGIVRSASVTPHEFQSQLIREGLPGIEVEGLTSLFERVRYGKTALTESEEKNAENCLRTVISALENR